MDLQEQLLQRMTKQEKVIQNDSNAQQAMKTKDNNQSNNKQPIQQKKKIIKKFPLIKKQFNRSEDDNLKDWKPEKINNNNQSKLANPLQKKTANIGISFLSSLPKPVNQQNSLHSNNIALNSYSKLNQNKKIKLSEQQLKWDAQDQILQRSKIILKNQMRLPESIDEVKFNEQDAQGQQYIQKIKWLNQQPKKRMEINLLDKIEKNWQKRQNNQQEDFDQIGQNKSSDKKSFNFNNLKSNKK